MSIGTGGTVIRTEILGANNRLRMVMVRSRKYDVAAALFLLSVIRRGGATTIRLALEQPKADPSHRKFAGSG
jgi:hypothetical protein